MVKAVSNSEQQKLLISEQDIKALSQANHTQPHQVLGLHTEPDSDYLVIRTYQPQAEQVKLIVKGTKAQPNKVLCDLEQIANTGIWLKKLRRKKVFQYQLAVTQQGHESLIVDSYAVQPQLPEFDIHLLAEGQHQKPYQLLGAHVKTIDKVAGVQFTVWAPNASSVAVVGDFNHWDGRYHLMSNINYSGYWSVFIAHLSAGCLYKYQIKDQQGKALPLKADPYTTAAQYRPDTASIVALPLSEQWQDDLWLAERATRNAPDAAISVYEVHLGSWRRGEDNQFLNYRDIAEQLIPYVLDMGFTHIQLLPVSEHPFDGSWGYQPVGLFAPSARFGNAEDFKFFVEQCHLANVGVIVDWVPGHFPTDDHGLAQFDGSHLFEHADPKQGFHPDWHTLIYNYGRTEVANFLRASALHWLDRFHVDGIRVDAVASMLYLDYSRKEGEWIPNKFGGRENLEAVAFLQRFNQEVAELYPDTITIAEESTSWPGVTKAVAEQGLGFDYKWNMGWMNDTLTYMKREPIHRQYHHNEMIFGLVYGFDEQFILPLSHDEVVHGKGSILARMPGDAWQQFANLRAYYGFMWAHPGKKLLFMGCEFGQGREWNHDKELDWHQLDIHWHAETQAWVKQLNQIYQQTPALYQQDCQSSGFQWLDHSNAEHSVLSFIRYAEQPNSSVIVIANFNNCAHHHFRIGVPTSGSYVELLNSDDEKFGGSGLVNSQPLQSRQGDWQEQQHFIEVTVPPLSTVMFKLQN